MLQIANASGRNPDRSGMMKAAWWMLEGRRGIRQGLEGSLRGLAGSPDGSPHQGTHGADLQGVPEVLESLNFQPSQPPLPARRS